MSGFVKRTKAVDTVNPAGGIDPAKSPNVGQYGWTSFDAGNVNQVIEYVDMCKKYTEETRQSAEYVESKVFELAAFMRYIEQVYEDIKPIYDNILPIYDDIIARHEGIKVLTEDTTKMHSDVEGWHYEVNVMTEETEANALKALTSQLLAGQSEQGAEGWYDKSYELYEDLRKGNIYRGTWNPHTAAYPDNGGTNSTWDVILNEGEIEFRWNNILWFWGDRLVYLKEDDLYQQIESGTTVTSVNGKKGAVVLSAEDVKAVPVTRTVNGKALSGNIDITATDTSSVPITRKINNKVLNADLNLTPEDIYSVPLGRTINKKPLSADVTLSAEDVKAVPVTRTVNGKALSDNISITSTDTNSVPTTRRVNNKVLDSDVVLTHADVQAVPLDRKINNKFLSTDVTLSAGDVKARPDTWTPTATDVGAVNKAGDTMTGPLVVKESGASPKLIVHRTDSNTNVGMGFRGLNDIVVNFGIGADRHLYYGEALDFVGAGSRIYSTTSKPTAADVGVNNVGIDGVSVNINTLGITDLNAIRTSGHYYTSETTDLNRPSASAGPVVHIHGSAGFQQYVRDNDLKFRGFTGTTFRPWQTVYHTGNKPTAFDIQVMDPRTKREETLMEVLLTMKSELDALKGELLITKEKLNEFILK
ncbi:MAG: pyocin knob domain-containing protein [Bacteroidales bacterium]